VQNQDPSTVHLQQNLDLPFFLSPKYNIFRSENLQPYRLKYCFLMSEFEFSEVQNSLHVARVTKIHSPQVLPYYQS
jgi:hypothetical protein